jgi:Arc-like DNA binding domain
MVTPRTKHSSIRRPSSLIKRVGDPLRRVAQLKVRLPEPLRRDLERAAAEAGHSMNTEIVRRLSESFKNYGKAKLIADSLLKDLDQDVLLEMFGKWIRDRDGDDGEPR